MNKIPYLQGLICLPHFILQCVAYTTARINLNEKKKKKVQQLFLFFTWETISIPFCVLPFSMENHRESSWMNRGHQCRGRLHCCQAGSACSPRAVTTTAPLPAHMQHCQPQTPPAPWYPQPDSSASSCSCPRIPQGDPGERKGTGLLQPQPKNHLY